MSRAFVNENSPKDDEPPMRPVSPGPNYVTPEGFKLLKTKAEELAGRRSALLSDSDDPELRRKRLLIERDLIYFKTRLETAILVDHTGKDFADIRMGAIIDARDDSGKNYRFEITGEDEAETGSGKLNCVSALADALLGKKAGEQAVWESGDGRRLLTIISVKYPPAGNSK